MAKSKPKYPWEIFVRSTFVAYKNIFFIDIRRFKFSGGPNLLPLADKWLYVFWLIKSFIFSNKFLQK